MPRRGTVQRAPSGSMPLPGPPCQEAPSMLSQAPEVFAHSALADIAKTHGPLEELQSMVTGKNKRGVPTVLTSGLVIAISTNVLP